MKELTLEEKAKRYDEALEKARNILDSTDDNYVCTYLTKEDIKGMYSKFFPELAESEDEKIRKSLISYLHGLGEFEYPNEKTYNNWLAWLEKQDRNPYSGVSFEYKGNTWGMCARDGGVDILLNGELIQHVSIEKQDGQKPQGKSALEAIKEEKVDNANKVEPKFQNGQWITNGDYTWKIVEVKPLDYILQSQDGNIVDDTISHVDEQFHSFTIKDAKEGDVLFMENASANSIFIYKSFNNGIINKYASYNNFGFEGEHYLVLNDGYVIPTTKEQRNTFFAKMKEAGYKWNAEKKELKKIEQKPAWSENDENAVSVLKHIIKQSEKINSNIYTKPVKEKLFEWLEALKNKYSWKPSEEL